MPTKQYHYHAPMLQADSDGDIILVTISPSDGADDTVAVKAQSQSAAIKAVKDWLISIDYDPRFKGIEFHTEVLRIDSLTLLGAEL